MSVEMNLSQKTCTSPLSFFWNKQLVKMSLIQMVEGIKRLRTLLLTREQNHSLGHNVKHNLMFLFWSPVHPDITILADWVLKKNPLTIYVSIHLLEKANHFSFFLFLPSTSLQCAYKQNASDCYNECFTHCIILLQMTQINALESLSEMVLYQGILPVYITIYFIYIYVSLLVRHLATLFRAMTHIDKWLTTMTHQNYNYPLGCIITNKNNNTNLMGGGGWGGVLWCLYDQSKFDFWHRSQS